eukprot:TRINITY_DN65235_c0_g1_i1.p1 TRINITY_DN65235_c0_g1~~TRINITY_DN65235_c0_g1_i1.p1  ORF type:complete len:648 (+),score=156.33 TRINITY_DN65235_c0_g1_i1:79-1944(+)
MADRRVHGDGGAFVGGDWLSIEECAERRSECQASSSGAACAGCPRRRSCSPKTAAKPDGSYDVVVIGAGVVGAAICRELSRTRASVLLLEQAEDVAGGATKANSGIVHSGFNSRPGSLRAKLCWPGCQLFPELDRELNFGFERNGSLVIARDERGMQTLQTLLQRGIANGVEGLRILTAQELRAMEPAVTQAALGALWSPHAGIVAPYEFAIALAENAVDNGVELRVRREVVGITKAGGAFEVTAEHWEPRRYLSGSKASRPRARLGVIEEHVKHAPPDDHPDMLAARGGSGSKDTTGGVVVGTEKFKCRFVLNCAGAGSARVARMVGDASFKILPRIGNFLVLRKEQGRLANATLFPCPDPVKGKGILVQHTLWGNLMLGPTARDANDPRDSAQSADEVISHLLHSARDLVPGIDARQVIHSFAGARSTADSGDWIIGPSAADPHFINVAGIGSPGLASSPAIAKMVMGILRDAGFHPAPDPTFNPIRPPIVRPKRGWEGLSLDLPGKPPDPDPTKRVVCRCERVTEAEVVDALSRSLPVDCTQSVRRRTRVGMGACQGNPGTYGCEDRVVAIIAREHGLRPEQVGRRPWPATSLLPQRWLSTDQKEHIAALGATNDEML